VALHGWFTGSHEAPAAPGDAHLPPLLHVLPTGQSPSAAHDAPAAGVSAHAPHVLPVAWWQYALLHCDESPHGAPMASAPATAWHEVGRLWLRTSSHDAPGMAVAQSAICAAVAPVLGAARAFASAVFAAEVHASTSPYSKWMKKAEQVLYLAQRAVAASLAACSAVTVPAVVPLPEHAARTMAVAVAAKGVNVRIAGIVSTAEQGSCLLARSFGYYVLGRD
jgi:hypothetical protein